LQKTVNPKESAAHDLKVHPVGKNEELNNVHDQVCFDTLYVALTMLICLPGASM